VPAAFDELRPGFKFSHIQHQSKIEQDPLASQLPRATTSPSVHPDSMEFNSLARVSDGPIKLEDYLSTDAPQLSLHIVSYENATLITLSWLHTFSDAMGAAALFDAWTLILNDRENEVKPFQGFDTDPLVTLGSSPSETYSLANLQVKGLSMLVFVIRYIFDLVWYRKEEGRVVCIPASTLFSVKEAAINDLAAAEGKTPFLSDGDVLSAWWSRLVLEHMPETVNRTISIMNAFSLRGVLSGSLLPPNMSYVSNAAAAVYAILPAFEILSKPVSFTASAVRRSIVEQGTEGQMHASAAIFKHGPLVLGDSSTFMIIISNWTKGNFYQVDFSGAVRREGTPVDQRANLVGRPSYAHVAGHSHKYPTRNSFPIFGQDAAGNYWLGGRLRAGVWAKIEEALKKNV
jgi:hypothetical protein